MGAALVIMAERKSRGVVAQLIRNRKAAEVTAALTCMLLPLKDSCPTITFGSGKECAGHEIIGGALQAGIYFAHPYRAWERGMDENSIRLLRQYFPRGKTFTNVSSEQVRYAVDHLNHRPRKVLGFWDGLHNSVFELEGPLKSVTYKL